MSNIKFSRIFLCGFMGSGKSTLGEILARLIGKQFIDLDDAIVKKAGIAISRIFQLYGEEYFRKLEKNTLDEVIGREEAVVALGGGALQNSELIQTIKANGLLVFIETPFDELLARIMKNRSRPLLLDKNGEMKDEETLKQDLSDLYYKRLPFYKEAHITFQSSIDKTPTEQAALLKERISEYEQTT